MSRFSSTATRLAVGLLGLEALALLALSGWEITALIRGDLVSWSTSIALLVLCLLATVGVAAFAVAVLRGRSWGRSGGIVTQVLIFAIAIGAVQGETAHWGIALALAAPAILAFVALILAARDASPRSSGE